MYTLHATRKQRIQELKQMHINTEILLIKLVQTCLPEHEHVSGAVQALQLRVQLMQQLHHVHPGL